VQKGISDFGRGNFFLLPQLAALPLTILHLIAETTVREFEEGNILTLLLTIFFSHKNEVPQESLENNSHFRLHGKV
jgi:hypothetical protein